MRPDFHRHVVCVLGLPFDVLTEAQAAQALLDAAQQRRPCFLSTPNLNFAVGCLSDPAFRLSVLQSDLSVADGWPVVTLGRWVGATLPERVAGSSLFERLAQHVGEPPLKVFFFGGPPGAAQAACERHNAQATGLRGVGFESPGFCTVEDMSHPDTLQHINASEADFVVVALGAKKGQAWIQHNRSRLRAPLLSHLGAVVNFAAGTVARAPRWVQRFKLEWVWRIKEEPALWRRYAHDGWALVKQVCTHTLPLALMARLARPSAVDLAQARCHIQPTQEGPVLRLEGAWTQANLLPLRQCLEDFVRQHRGPLQVNLAKTTYLDSAALGLLLLLHGWNQHSACAQTVIAASPKVQRLLRLAGASYLRGDTPSRA